MRLTAHAVALLALAGCLDDEVGPDQGEEFVAFQDDFEDYASWDSWQVGDDPVGDTHLTGPRFVFANVPPPEGTSPWPDGAVLVKEARNGDREDWDVFAMVKRGSGFNAGGAAGWEWFELSLDQEVPTILWRGEKPPTDAGYVGLSADGHVTDGDCNGCHLAAWEHDYVQSADLLGDAP